MFGNRTWIISGVVAVAVVLAAGAVARPDQDPATVSLRLKWIYYATFAGNLLAQDRRYYEEEGINVDVRPGGFEMNPIRLVATGQDTFGMAGSDELLLARAQGAPLVAVFALIQQSPVAFMSKEESGIRSPKDFEGRVVGRKHGTDVDTQYEYLLKVNGVDRSKITEVPVRFDLTPFLSGNVHVFPGYSMAEPVETRLQGVPVTVLLARDYGIRTYSNVIFTTEETVQKRPGLVRQLLSATLKGWERAFANKEEAVSAVLKRNANLKRDQQLAVLKEYEQFVKPTASSKLGSMDRKVWEETAEMLRSLGKLDSNFSIEGAYTTTFLEELQEKP